MHVDALTLFWDAVALTGTGFSLATLPQYLRAHKGAQSTRRIPNEDDRRLALRIAHDYIWAECSRLCCHIISLGLGITSAFIPQMEREPQSKGIVIYGLVVVCGIVAINCLTVQNSVRAYVAWRRR